MWYIEEEEGTSYSSLVFKVRVIFQGNQDICNLFKSSVFKSIIRYMGVDQ